MSVANGEKANANTFNTSFISTETDSQTIAKIDLNRTGSGNQIPDAQQQINDNETDIATNRADIDSNDIELADHEARISTNETDVGLNNAHRVGDGSDHADVATNTVHISSDGKDHSDVVLNNSHRVDTANPHSITPLQVGNTTAQWNADQLQGVDVHTTAPNDTEVLTYSTANTRWEAAPAGGGGASLTQFEYGEDLTAGDPIQVYNDAGTAKVKSVGIITAGETFTASTVSVANTWRGVTYGAGLFVACSSTGTGDRIMTSPDGITWTTRTSAADNVWNDITYDGALFVACSSSGTGNRIMTSPDGITWTSRTSSIDSPFYAVTHGGGVFVVVGSGGGVSQVMTSPDGISWTTRSSAAGNQWNGVAYDGSQFCAVSSFGSISDAVMTSPDGITWTSRTASTNNNWQDIAFGNGVFVAVASNGSIGNKVMTSPDGITWTDRTAAESNNWEAVAFGGSLFVATARTGTNRVMTSPDGITWTSRSASSADQWYDIAYGNNAFVGVASSSSAAMVSQGSDTISKYFGIAQTTAVSGTTNDVAILGDISTVHSGETAGLISYVQSDGTLGSTLTDQPSGKYTSSTELLVTNTPETVVADDSGGGGGAAPTMIRLTNSATLQYGSTDTRIPLFDTVINTVGTDVTYANTAANGTTFTINTSGTYHLSWTDKFSNYGQLGFSLNSTALTSTVEIQTTAVKLTFGWTVGAGFDNSITWSGYLQAGDIIRPHGDGTTRASAATRALLSISN